MINHPGSRNRKNVQFDGTEEVVNSPTLEQVANYYTFVN